MARPRDPPAALRQATPQGADREGGTACLSPTPHTSVDNSRVAALRKLKRGRFIHMTAPLPTVTKCADFRENSRLFASLRQVINRRHPDTHKHPHLVPSYPQDCAPTPGDNVLRPEGTVPKARNRFALRRAASACAGGSREMPCHPARSPTAAWGPHHRPRARRARKHRTSKNQPLMRSTHEPR